MWLYVLVGVFIIAILVALKIAADIISAKPKKPEEPKHRYIPIPGKGLCNDCGQGPVADGHAWDCPECGCLLDVEPTYRQTMICRNCGYRSGRS